MKTFLAVLIAILCAALLLSYIESALGLRVAFLPWLRLGLANIVVAFAFFEASPRMAAAVSFSRVIIMGVLFGSPVSFLYSFCGAVLSFCGLLIARLLGGRISYIGASSLCAALHNVGQAAVAACFFGVSVAAFYLPYLLVTGAFFGIVTGILLNFFSSKLGRIFSE